MLTIPSPIKKKWRFKFWVGYEIFPHYHAFLIGADLLPTPGTTPNSGNATIDDGNAEERHDEEGRETSGLDRREEFSKVSA